MKKISTIISIISFMAASTDVVFAQTPGKVTTQLCPPAFANLCKVNLASGNGLVGGIIQMLFIVAILVSLFFLIFGGIRYIMSGGDRGKLDQSRATITAALVGLVIALCAFAITTFVLMFFTGQGLSQLNIPKLL